MKMFQKLLALGCCAALTISSLSGCSENRAASDSNTETTNPAAADEITAIQDTLNQLEGASNLTGHSDTARKEETVYAILDADGNLEQTIVSEWLKNAKGSTTLEDRSNLSDITVVKGDAEYSKTGSNDQIVWSNDGSDIYYQGTSSKELPVDVHISYELDGKSVTAKELKGASGHLKITFTYTNHASKKVMLNGKNETTYQPFTMISGMLLDNEKAKNITVDNGSTVNSGDDTLVFGVAMPGLKESMGLDQATDSDGKPLELEIPESVSVEADITDFSMLMTLTVASNQTLSQLGLDEIHSIDDLKADMEKLTDGMDSIIDGASQLNDGGTELQTGTQTLSDGAKQLSNGSQSLSDGSKQVSDGAKQVNSGAAALKDGLNSLNQNTPALADGVDALTTGSEQLSAGFQTITQNNQTLTNGAKQLSDGLSTLEQSLNSKENAENINKLTSGSTTFSQGLEQASNGLNQIVAGYSYSDGDLANLINGLTQYAQALSASGDPTNAAYAKYIQTMIETYKSLYQNVSTAQAGVSNLAAAYQDIDTGIQTTAGSISGISQAVAKLSQGAGKLESGVNAYTSGVSQTSDGVKTLTDGLQTLNAQVPSLVSGIQQLSDGADTLANGTGTLANGAANLADGAKDLNNGTTDLNSGISKLLDGVLELVNGTGDLKDGVIQFNEEGIQQLAEIVNQDLESYYNRFQALQDYADEYTSFAGCQDDVTCSVKFIYKTDSIE